MLAGREKEQAYVSEEMARLVTFQAEVTALDQVVSAVRDLHQMYGQFATRAQLADYALRVRLQTSQESVEFLCCSPDWQKEIRIALRYLQPPAHLTVEPATDDMARQLLEYLTSAHHPSYTLTAQEKAYTAIRNQLVNYADKPTR